MTDPVPSLYLVSTPIGNLKEITFRAIDVLKKVDLIAAEDTRTTKKLLDHYQIQTPLTAYYDQVEKVKAIELIDYLKKGKTLALVSEAGTPLVSDPGYVIVNLCQQHQIPVFHISGACAAISALVVSGLPNHSFIFEGFLPQKKGRQSRLKELATEKRTLILYESPYRLLKLLDEIQTYFGNREISVSKELSKLHEKTISGLVSEVIIAFDKIPIKGEFVVVIKGMID